MPLLYQALWGRGHNRLVFCTPTSPPTVLSGDKHLQCLSGSLGIVSLPPVWLVVLWEVPDATDGRMWWGDRGRGDGGALMEPHHITSPSCPALPVNRAPLGSSWRCTAAIQAGTCGLSTVVSLAHRLKPAHGGKTGYHWSASSTLTLRGLRSTSVGSREENPNGG